MHSCTFEGAGKKPPGEVRQRIPAEHTCHRCIKPRPPENGSEQISAGMSKEDRRGTCGATSVGQVASGTQSASPKKILIENALLCTAAAARFSCRCPDNCPYPMEERSKTAEFGGFASMRGVHRACPSGLLSFVYMFTCRAVPAAQSSSAPNERRWGRRPASLRRRSCCSGRRRR